MRYDREHKERTRQRILAEAASAIRLQGPDRVGLADIMASLGLTHGGFYAHFRSKDDLVAQAITFMFDETYAWFLGKTEGRPPAEALHSFITAYLSGDHREARGRGCAVASLAGDLPRMPELARARFSEGAERLPAGIARLLQKLERPDPDLLATSVVAEMAGALALARAVSDGRRSDQILEGSRRLIKARLGLAEPEPETAR